VLACWSIRNKLLLGVAMLLLIGALLAFSSFRGSYAYRHLARSISYRGDGTPAGLRDLLVRGRTPFHCQPRPPPDGPVGPRGQSPAG